MNHRDRRSAPPALPGDARAGASPAPGGPPGEPAASSGGAAVRFVIALGRVSAAVLRPFTLALLTGSADPPPRPRSRWLRMPVPRWLAPLVPVQTFSLLQVAELLIAVELFGVTLSTVTDWNEQAAATPGAPLPLWGGVVVLAALAAGLPVALRNRWPLAAWRAAVVLTPVAVYAQVTIGRDEGYAPYPMTVGLAYLLALYSVGVRCERRITLGAGIITVLLCLAVDADSAPVVAGAAGIVVLFGYNVRARRNATARLIEEERRTRQAEGAHAVLEERARIARELHDVVAHHMSVIAIQAEAVPLRAAGDPSQLEAGLAEIRALSLEAITELRQVLGVLRDPDGRTDTAPQPGLDRLEELVGNARNAGLTVEVGLRRPIGPLPQAVGLSAYRIVQESLSNAMRHAPGSSVTVEITHDDGTLRLRVANGPGRSPAAAPGAGQGLAGMRERAALLGGTLDAGPARGGGYQVSAELPIEPPTESPIKSAIGSPIGKREGAA
ncbi:sensor histidine kinase [Nonomuraea sp. NPDC047529]|uniref:sensor histidine kinase n=1 Tax=Nonomuraea sp. NPDC047529 TaxID=3155623 RepID=UPI0033DA45E3